MWHRRRRDRRAPGAFPKLLPGLDQLVNHAARFGPEPLSSLNFRAAFVRRSTPRHSSFLPSGISDLGRVPLPIHPPGEFGAELKEVLPPGRDGVCRHESRQARDAGMTPAIGRC
jgi:hypothetical protein